MRQKGERARVAENASESESEGERED